MSKVRKILVFLFTGLLAHSLFASADDIKKQILELKYESPVQYIDAKEKLLKQYIMQRKLPLASSMATKEKPIKMKIKKAVKTYLFRELYKQNIIDASIVPAHVFDKLFAYHIFRSFLGEKADKWYPKTMGLKYFLEKNKLLDDKHNIVKDEAKLKAALSKEFPAGYIVKPATGFNSQGKTKGFYFKMPEFLADLMKAEEMGLYQASEFKTPQKPFRVPHTLSGEKLIIQENVVLAAGINMEVKPKSFKEVRVHSFEKNSIKGLTFARWKEIDDQIDKETLTKARLFIQEFLNALPVELMAKQAWSYDVAALDNGVFRLIEINTNHGHKEAWSSYLARPTILAGFFIYLEENYPFEFSGFTAFLFRNGMANWYKFLKKRFIDGTI